MSHLFAGVTDEFEDGTRKVISGADTEIVVFRHRDRYYAFENYCQHSGGPVGEGLLIGQVQAVLGADQTYQGEDFSNLVTHLVCPWHGYEYDIETGVCAGDPKIALRRYQVTEQDGSIYVVA